MFCRTLFAVPQGDSSTDFCSFHVITPHNQCSSRTAFQGALRLITSSLWATVLSWSAVILESAVTFKELPQKHQVWGNLGHVIEMPSPFVIVAFVKMVTRCQGFYVEMSRCTEIPGMTGLFEAWFLRSFVFSQLQVILKLNDLKQTLKEKRDDSAVNTNGYYFRERRFDS